MENAPALTNRGASVLPVCWHQLSHGWQCQHSTLWGLSIAGGSPAGCWPFSGDAGAGPRAALVTVSAARLAESLLTSYLYQLICLAG